MTEQRANSHQGRFRSVKMTTSTVFKSVTNCLDQGNELGRKDEQAGGGDHLAPRDGGDVGHEGGCGN